MSTHDFESLSNQAIAFAAIVYFLALLAHSLEWGRSLKPRKAAARTASSASAAGSTAVLEREAVDEDDRGAFLGRLGLLLTVLAAVLHLVAVVSRGLAAERVPWGNMYEFTLTGTAVVAVAYLLSYRRLKLAWAAPFVVGIVLVLLMLAVVALYAPVEPLTESLNSYWLVIHVIAAILATGGFTLGGVIAVAYLVKSRRPDATTGVLGRLPSLDRLDRSGYAVHAFAFPVWTFAVLIAGPIWAHQAWGSAWNWDPKEVWAFITWVVYAAYLHARTTVGWKGKRAAWLAVVGLLTLWFNFVGINYFSSTSMHSYAEGASVESVLDL